MKKWLLLIVFLWASALMAAQSSNDRQKALEYGKQAIYLMDKEQKYGEALKLLKKAAKLDPDNIAYQYEIAYAYYVQKNYGKVISILKKVVKNDRADEKYIRLLGAAYDLDGKFKEAEKLYRKGIDRFPFAGELYLEMGGLEYRRGRTDIAVNYWEQGIRRDPTFTTNYYWATKMYLNSNEMLWGLLYGELFLNLEQNSIRAAEVGKMMHHSLTEALTFVNEEKGNVTLSEKAQMYLLLEGMGPIDSSYLMPFPAACELTMKISFGELLHKKILTPESELEGLIALREKFLDKWYYNNRPESYPNIVFERQRQIQEAGYFEAYQYWLLKDGDYAQFTKWLQNHQYTYKGFLNWLADNPLNLNEQRKFHRLQYYETSY